MRNEICADVTSRVLEALEAGTVPWQRPWNLKGAHHNLSSGREYQGINVFLLNITSSARGYASSAWLTFNQCKSLGGSVRAGERATRIVYWKVIEKPAKNPDDDPVRLPMLRQYCVFNAEQCDLPDDIAQRATPTSVATIAPDEAAETIWARYAGAPSLHHGGDAAYYMPTLDRIVLPSREDFHSTCAYYHTLFHEATHSTGHPSRLNRATLQQARRFGDADYSQEELVAELGSAMLLSHAGMRPDWQNTAAYLHGWLAALRADRRLILVAAQQAQKAANHILGPSTAQPVEESALPAEA